jgi:hypothetical protein
LRTSKSTQPIERKTIMQILQPGFVPKRKSSAEVVNPQSPSKPVRVRLTRDCVVWTGFLGKADDVYEFDASTPEGFEAVAMLTGHSTSGQKVPPSTPLRTAGEPVAKRKG